MLVPEIDPKELYKLLQGNSEQLFLLDVREPEEHARVAIRPSLLIPLMELPQNLLSIKETLEKGEYKSVVVYCRSGQRSELAAEFLRGSGIADALNLRGGINAYAREADHSLMPNAPY